MGPIVTRLFNAARPPKRNTIEEQSDAYMRDTLATDPGAGPDEEGMLKTPNRRRDMRKRYPNPKRAM